MSKQENLFGKDSIKDDDYYIVSRFSDCYHRPDCVWARKIKRANKAPYTRTKNIAGRKPCKHCRP